MYQIRAGPVQARYGYERSNVTKMSRKDAISLHVFSGHFRDNREHSNPQKF